MSKKNALKAVLLVLVGVLCAAAVLAEPESSEADSPRLESFAPTEKVRADDAVPFPVNI